LLYETETLLSEFCRGLWLMDKVNVSSIEELLELVIQTVEFK